MSKDLQIAIDFYKEYSRYKGIVEKHLATCIVGRKPSSVYEPIRYVLRSGGKRFRAVIVLLSCEAVGGKMNKALDAAAAIEILHNFTLVHDDVMDHADVRRGKQTVHTKWDENVAILSGDEMIAQAYKAILKTKSQRLKQALDVYTDALIQVCEGQGFDKEFELGKNITVSDYFQMIAKKTGRIIAAAAEIGALIGGGDARQVTSLRRYGEHLGRAFQVMDDLLDVVGNPKEFGKKIGGDIQEGKKTYLLLKALEKLDGIDRKVLQSIMQRKRITKVNIKQVRYIYERSGVIALAENEIARCTHLARHMLLELPQNQAVMMLDLLSHQLLKRTY